MSDEHLYERAMQEIHERKVIRALWAKALADADGDKVKTVARYVRLRVAQLQQEAGEEAPPAAPAKKLTRPTSEHYSNQASGWRRFFARTIDLLWEGFFVILLAWYVMHQNPELSEFVHQTNPLLLNVMLLPLMLLLDAAVHELFFRTPGKALLGLETLDSDGKRLGIDKYLERNFRLWCSGLAFGLPVVNLFCMAYQSGRVKKSGYATYDQERGVRVIAVPLGPLRVAAAFLVGAVLVTISAVMMQVPPGGLSQSAAPTKHEADNRPEWLVRVREIQSLIAAGQLEVLPADYVYLQDVRGGIWPKDSTVAVYDTMTWWVDSGAFSTAIMNASPYNVRVIGFDLYPVDCGNTDARPFRFYVQLNRVLPSGESAVIRFHTGSLIDQDDKGTKCLVIADLFD